MPKIMYGVRRRPDLSGEGFDRYWIEHHAPLVRTHAHLLGIRRYVQTVWLANPEAQRRLRTSRGAEAVDFDGCAELSYDDMKSHLDARKTPKVLKALQLLIEDERRFIVLRRAQLWYATERAIIRE